MIDDENLEARLARWQPADPPPDLLRRLRAAEPPRPAKIGSLRPWPLAYAGLLAAWALILVLRLLTPPGAGPTPPQESAPLLAGPATEARVCALGHPDPELFRP